MLKAITLKGSRYFYVWISKSSAYKVGIGLRFHIIVKEYPPTKSPHLFIKSVSYKD